MNEILINAFVEIFTGGIGAAIGAYLAFIIAKNQFQTQKDSEDKQKRLDITLDFFAEFASYKFAQNRREAGKIFKRNLNAVNLDSFYSTLNDDEKQSILETFSFFRRLQLVIEHNRIDKNMALELFAEEFLHWYFVYFAELIPTNWATYKSIDMLHKWFYKNMDRQEYELRKKNAETRRKELLVALKEA